MYLVINVFVPNEISFNFINPIVYFLVTVYFISCIVTLPIVLCTVYCLYQKYHYYWSRFQTIENTQAPSQLGNY